ncbi:MAG: ClpXP protease specificity-enhancing factor SspB, partial [Gammaproteobacteria bacterium]
QQIYIPIQHILAIYAAENGQGMVFSQEFETNEAAETNDNQPLAEVDPDNQTGTVDTDDNPSDKDKAKQSKSFLKVIK